MLFRSQDALDGIRDAPVVHRDIPAELTRTRLRLPPRAVGQALRSLVTNAQDASPPTAAVVVAVRCHAGMLELAIRDRGAGMPREILARIGEPFFTTKPPGRGMGLGLFLARAVIEAVGGTLQIDSVIGEGTAVLVVLPTDVSHPSSSSNPSNPSNPPDDASRRSERSRESLPHEVVSKPA